MQNERPPALLVSHNVAGFKTYLAKVGQFVKGGFKVCLYAVPAVTYLY